MGIISGLGSFRGQFGDHFRVGDHFGVGIISGAVQIQQITNISRWSVSNSTKKTRILKLWSPFKLLSPFNFELPPRLSNLTHNRQRQERKLYKCRNNPLSALRCFMLRPLVFVIRSFLFVSVSLFRLNSTRRGTVTFVVLFVWWSRW